MVIHLVPISECHKPTNREQQKPNQQNQSQSPFERALQRELKKVRPQGYPSC